MDRHSELIAYWLADFARFGLILFKTPTKRGCPYHTIWETRLPPISDAPAGAFASTGAIFFAGDPLPTGSKVSKSTTLSVDGLTGAGGPQNLQKEGVHPIRDKGPMSQPAQLRIISEYDDYVAMELLDNFIQSARAPRLVRLHGARALDDSPACLRAID